MKLRGPVTAVVAMGVCLAMIGPANAAPTVASVDSGNNTMAVPGATATALGAAPQRVQIRKARRFPHRVDLTWSPALTGPRPTSYQVRLQSGRWQSTKRPATKVTGLKPWRSYRISVRAMRKGKAGPSVVVQVGPMA